MTSPEKADLKIVDIVPPDSTIIESMKKLLRMAERGEITGFAIATIHADGSFGTEHTCAEESRLLGTVTYLQARLVRRIESL